MKAKQTKQPRQPETTYGVIYAATRAEVLKLSGMTAVVLDDNGFELHEDYNMFCYDYDDYHDLDLYDCHEGFVAMMQQWPSPWSYVEDSGLNGLTVAQFFFTWAWDLNNSAKRHLNGEAVAQGWKPEDALLYGVRFAVSAAKSLAHAKALVAAGDKRLGMERLDRAAA